MLVATWNVNNVRKRPRPADRLLSKLLTKLPAMDPGSAKPGRWSKRGAGTERWVEPSTVVEVSFSEWTPDKQVRHPTFRGVRTDKAAREIRREVSRGSGLAMESSQPPSVRITNPTRVIDAATGLKKVDLVRYYESVAQWMLPHLKGRPVALVRAPQGIGGQAFFHKHPADAKMPGVTELPAELWPGHAPLMSVDTPEALVAAAQMNTIEFHTWNSVARSIEKPDRMVFDLDPGEGIAWPTMREAAMLMQAMLDELDLQCWLKTSGGKGLNRPGI